MNSYLVVEIGAFKAILALEFEPGVGNILVRCSLLVY